DFPPAATLAVVLIGAAAVLRVGAGWIAPEWLMPGAAVAWTAAHLLILGAVARILRRPRRKAI
ncbi:MAG TPA: NnrS family protein, partial [Azospirillum sp.]